MPVDIGPRIGLEGEESYSKQISRIIKLQKQLSAEMKGTEAAFRADASEREKARQRTKLLNDQLDVANRKYAEQKRALKEMEEAGKGSSAAADQLRLAMSKTGAEIERIKRELRANDSLAALGKDMQVAGQKIKSVGDGLARFGTTMTRSVTVPLTAAGVAAVKLAADFETSLAKLDSIADTSAKSMDTLKNEIMDLSSSTGIAASELAEQTYQAISAGRDTASAVNFVANAAKLSKAGFTETGNALDVLTTIMNAYGMSAEQVTNVSDKLIQTQNLGKVTVAQLSETMGDAIPTAASMGVNLDNLSSVYVTLTKQGINAASATTQINGLMNQLGKSGTKASNALKKRTGKTFQELMSAGYNLADVLKIVAEEAEDSGVSMNDMFSNVRAGRAALALMNDGGETFTKTLASMSKAIGTTDAAFEKVTDTSAHRFEVALNKVKNTGIEAGNQLMRVSAPAIEKIGDFVERATTRFAEMSDEEQQAIIKTTMFAASIGPAVTVLGKMTSGIGSAVIGAGKLIETFALTGTIGVPAVLGIAAAFTTLTVVLMKAFDAQIKYNNEFSDSFNTSQKAIESSKKLRESVEATGDAYKKSAEEIGANEKRANKLADEIERLGSKTNRSAKENARLSAAVSELNEIYPGLNLAIDANTGKLNKNNDEIRENIKQYSEQARAIAAQERAVEINKEILKVESELVDLREKRAEAEKTATDALKAANAEGEKYGHITAQGKAVADEAAKKTEELTEEISAQEAQLGLLNQQLTTTETYLTEHSDALAANTEATEENAAKNAELSESFEEEAAAAQQAAEKIMEAARLSGGAFDEAAKVQKKSIEELIKGLQSQIKAQQNYRSNLQTLNKYIQKDTSHNWDQVIKIFEEGGIEMAGELQGIVDAIERGDTDALSALAELTSGVEDETTASGKALVELSQSTSDAFGKIPPEIRKKKSEIITESRGTAKGVVEGWKLGTAKSGFEMATDARTSLNAPIETIKAGKKDVQNAAKTAGEGEPEGFKAGVNAKKSEATKAAGSVIDDTRKTIRDKGPGLRNESESVGGNISDGLASGIAKRQYKVERAAAQVAQAAINKMKAVPVISSPSKVTTEYGEYIAEGLINGMLSKIRDTKMAAATLARAALPGIGGNTYMDASVMGVLDADEMYDAVRQGAADAARPIYLNGREVTRGLKDLGVSFA